ncbi:MAG: hypothetical protein KAR21_17330 [Spirochaetales bacterium]|nr:hypothetical protein [Spirochaetales bacterium]
MTNTINHRILYRMKVTANIADSIIEEVKELTHQSTITEAITIALKQWIDMYHIKALNTEVMDRPFEFQSGYSAASIRELNRKR